MKELTLRYGTNPNQVPARVYMQDGSDLPLTVLGGSPGALRVRADRAVNALPSGIEGRTMLRSRTVLALSISLMVLQTAHAQRKLRMGLQSRERRAQLMRGIGNEAPLR